MNEILYKHITNYFDTNDTADKVCGKLVSTISLMAPIAAIIQPKNGEAVDAYQLT